MKNNKALIITNIIILSCIVISLLIFMIFGMRGEISFIGNSKKLVLTKIFDNSNFDNIKIDVKSYDIKLVESASEKFEVEVYGNKKTKNNIEISDSNGILKIKQIKSSICIGLCFGSSNIILKVPKSYQNVYNINTISGEIVSKISFHSENNRVTSTSGDIELQEVTSGKIKSTSGDIEVLSLDDGSVSTTSGDIEINFLKNGNVSSTSGDVEIENFKGYGELETTSGDINVDRFEILGNTSISSTSGEIKIKLINEAYITAESVSGDKNIRASRGEYDLRLKTISGDITVK